MEENIQKIVALIQESPLDQTVKEILIRDLEAEGLTDFLREQIEAYCTDGIEKLDKKIASAEKFIQANPSA